MPSVIRNHTWPTTTPLPTNTGNPLQDLLNTITNASGGGGVTNPVQTPARQAKLIRHYARANTLVNVTRSASLRAPTARIVGLHVGFPQT